MSRSIAELQVEQKAWADYNFGKRPADQPLKGMVEELGELHHHLLKQEQGIRGTWEEHEAKAKDSVGDFFVFLMDFCQLRGWNLQEIIEQTWDEVRQRDWVKDRMRGVVATDAIQS